MRPVARSLAAVLVLIFCIACQAAPAGADGPPIPAVPDCPPSLSCILNPPAYVNARETGEGTYNYTRINRSDDPRPIRGIVLHTTEGSTDSTAGMSQMPYARSSWNYLMEPEGRVQQSVPLGAVAYNSANRYYNSGYVQIEIVGYAGQCSVTDAQYRSLVELSRYLAGRFGFPLNADTVIGHDNVPGVSDAGHAGQHWDPGSCFDWQRLLGDMGAPVTSPGDVRQSSIVTVAPPFSQNVQPGNTCEDDQPETAIPCGQNFVTVYSSPSEQAPLFGDPYLHEGGEAGTAAPDDWGAKAPYGHSYVVADRIGDWTGIWFGGKLGWVQNKYLAPASQATKVATPKFGSATVYGRPMPTLEEFDGSALPDETWKAMYVPAGLSRYAFLSGQSYVVAPVEVTNTFYAGCDKTDCKAPGDGTIINGADAYLMLRFGHRYVFVKEQDVTISSR